MVFIMIGAVAVALLVAVVVVAVACRRPRSQVILRPVTDGRIIKVFRIVCPCGTVYQKRYAEGPGIMPMVSPSILAGLRGWRRTAEPEDGWMCPRCVDEWERRESDGH